MTYYNEDKNLTARTLHGVMKNVRDIVKKGSSRWRNKPDSWKDIVVCMILDGIEPADKEVFDLLAGFGVYRDGVIRGKVNDKDTTAHIVSTSNHFTSSRRKHGR